jgi:hypothetical protein
MQRMTMFREAMDELRGSTEQMLGKILDKKQAARLKQIELQLEVQRQGLVGVVLREDMMEKLAIEEDQVVSLREIQMERRELQKATRKTQGQIFQTIRNQAQAADEEDGGGDANGGNANGGNANGGNAGNGGNRGGRNRPSPEAMKKAMDDPEVKAVMEKGRKEQESIDNKTTLAVSKILSKRQRSLLAGMIGAKFDLAALGGPGGFGGQRGGGATAKNGATAKSGATAGGTRQKSSTPAPAVTESAPKRKSLQDLRGTPDDNPE